MIGDQSQDVVMAVFSPCSGATPPVKSDHITSITCYMDADCCQSWKRAIVDVTTIGGMACPCCCIGMVTVSTEEGGSAKISVLVVHSRPQRFDLLLGIDAIKVLGGIAVGPLGRIQISDGGVAKCAAITINEPDFTATFDHQNWAWIVAWK